MYGNGKQWLTENQSLKKRNPKKLDNAFKKMYYTDSSRQIMRREICNKARDQNSFIKS